MASFNAPLSEITIAEVADLFKLFSDSTRIEILIALAQGERSVSEITTVLKRTQPAVSHQLRLLKAGRLVVARRSGTSIYYRLADDHVLTLLAQGVDHVTE